MTTMKDRIQSDLHDAIRARDEVRKVALRMLTAAIRNAEIVAKEEGELAWLEGYLPRQAPREEIEAAARRVVAGTGASGPRDIGKVMPVLMQEFAGRTDGRIVSEIVRELLAGQ